jgi:L-cysteine S-thiosulfotransferase
MRQLMPVTALVCALALPAGAEVIAPGDVEFADGAVEASLTGAAGDPAAGRDTMNKGSGNCIACHMVSDMAEFPFHGEIGPPLDGAGDRWTEAELRGIVSNAKMMFPDSMMPSFYRIDGFTRPGEAFTGKAPEGPLTPILSAQEVEDVVAYLQTLTE